MALKKLVRKGKPPHKRPSMEPQHVSDDTWFYDDKKGIQIVHRVYDAEGGLIQTEQFLLPWKAIVASATRCGKI